MPSILFFLVLVFNRRRFADDDGAAFELVDGLQQWEVFVAAQLGGPALLGRFLGDLNQCCVCHTLDRDALRNALIQETGDPSFCTWLIKTRPHLFADVAVFVSEAQLTSMRGVVAAIETVTRHPAYQATILGWAPASAHRDFGPRGAFMGYDFHMGPDGPALIEVNTNAGGAMLNGVLAQAQRSCCAPESSDFPTDSFEATVAQMFAAEWVHQRSNDRNAAIAIVDDQPADQFLIPNFCLCSVC